MIRKLLLLLIFAIPTLTRAQIDTLLFDGLKRSYLVHTPTGYTGSEDMPLVVAMHGGFGSALNLQNQSQLSVKADEENFIVVYPEGVKSPLNISSWNAGGCCGYAATNNIDDVGFIDSLLDYLILNFAIDEDRIYATGMSNGGMLAYRLACEMPERIAAIAPVSTTMVADICNPTKPVPIIHFHSYNDQSVPYDGGIGPGGVSMHYNPPLDSVFGAWNSHNSCQSDNDTIVHDSNYTLVTWTDCECLYEIQYYITTDGGHSWHGGKTTLTGDTVSNRIIANDKMWDFFQIHSLECRSIGMKQIEENKVLVYPNPNNGKFKIEIPSGTEALELELINAVGQTVYIGESLEINTVLASGLYHLHLKTEHEVMTSKVLISR
jgi:polyhydroxybutyrate depolymerase